MASRSLSPFCRLSRSRPICRNKSFNYCRVRSQSFKDKEKPENIVDANLNILRQRTEELVRKETLRREWCYRSVYVPKPRLEIMLSESVELMALATGSFGFVFLSGSLWTLHLHCYSPSSFK